jgi:hypothetical protein
VLQRICVPGSPHNRQVDERDVQFTFTLTFANLRRYAIGAARRRRMLNLTKALSTTAVGGFLVLGALVATTHQAAAGSYDSSCDRYDCGRVYCDDDGDNCYRVVNRDDRYGDYDRRYRDDDWRRHYVCDSDGDRCYPSASDYWNYREYYRRLGYRWRD